MWFSKKLSKVGRQSDKDYFDDYGNSCEKEDDDGDEKENIYHVSNDSRDGRTHRCTKNLLKVGAVICKLRGYSLHTGCYGTHQ